MIRGCVTRVLPSFFLYFLYFSLLGAVAFFYREFRKTVLLAGYTGHAAEQTPPVTPQSHVGAVLPPCTVSGVFAMSRTLCSYQMEGVPLLTGRSFPIPAFVAAKVTLLFVWTA